jgi:hypothetical protein
LSDAVVRNHWWLSRVVEGPRQGADGGGRVLALRRPVPHQGAGTRALRLAALKDDDLVLPVDLSLESVVGRPEAVPEPVDHFYVLTVGRGDLLAAAHAWQENLTPFSAAVDAAVRRPSTVTSRRRLGSRS